MAEYIGLRAIGRRMGWDKNKVRRMIIKWGFQAYLFLNARGGHQLVWYTNDDLINMWYGALVQVSRDHLLESKTAKTLKKAWKTACKESKLSGTLVHDLRRTAAS